MNPITLKLIAVIFIAVSCMLIYDAREIFVNNFSKEDGLSTIQTLKFLGIIIAWIGMSILYMIK